MALKCPRCGSEARETDNYCPNCGYPLKQTAGQTSQSVLATVAVASLAALLLLTLLGALAGAFWAPWRCPMCSWRWPAYALAPALLPGFWHLVVGALAFLAVLALALILLEKAL